MITPSNFGCENVLELLDDYRRGKLEPHFLVLVSEHLETCDSCAQELQLRETISTHLNTALPDSAAQTSLSPAVQRAINQMSLSLTARKSGQLLPLMLSGAAVIMIGIALLQLNSTPSLQRSTDIAAAKPRAVSSSSPKPGVAADTTAGTAQPATAYEAKTHAYSAPAPAASQTKSARSESTAGRALFADLSNETSVAKEASAAGKPTSAAASMTTATALTSASQAVTSSTAQSPAPSSPLPFPAE